MPPILDEEQQAASAQAPDTAAEESSSDVNWDEFAGPDAEGDLEVIEPTTDEASPPERGQEESQVAAAPAAAVTPPAASTPPAVVPASQTPPAVAAPAPAAETPQPAAQAAPPAAQAPDYAAWRQNNMTALEREYGLSEDDANTMLTEPEKVLPKLAATLHMNITEHVMRSVAAMVPNMIGQVQESSQRENQAKSEFYKVNDDLADPKFTDAILQMGAMYRQVNGSAPPQEAILAIGNLVRTAMGLPLRAAGGAPAPAAAPAVQAQPSAFVPARGGSGGAGYAPAAPQNVFSQLADDLFKDD